MIRVLVVDDESDIRAGIRSVLDSQPDIEVQAEATDGEQAIATALSLKPDVVLMDIRMPGTDGLSATEEIRAHRPSQPVVILTTFGDDRYIDHAVALGVNGFLIKSGDPYDLIRAVTAAATGGASLSPPVAAYLLRTLHERKRPHSGGAESATKALSARELGVLGLVGLGFSNAEIAARLHLTEGTIKGYISTIFARLGVRNRVEAAIIAHEAGLAVDDDENPPPLRRPHRPGGDR
ncbi:DNA-binding response regulator [Frondihabitans sucicola]|uniref:DNA-binding response regulator n=1 Tax=Frondihabitans sucicola TaxID=1268041 RepID=A0ABN6XSD2_9MICO|nr:response regulator transcription factor [Frondihabitans sucicola]BDZ47909.1 DNA-binding response regulator [Frondihabitans sucicola]